MENSNKRKEAPVGNNLPSITRLHLTPAQRLNISLDISAQRIGGLSTQVSFSLEALNRAVSRKAVDANSEANDVSENTKVVATIEILEPITQALEIDDEGWVKADLNELARLRLFGNLVSCIAGCADEGVTDCFVLGAVGALRMLFGELRKHRDLSSERVGEEIERRKERGEGMAKYKYAVGALFEEDLFGGYRCL